MAPIYFSLSPLSVSGSQRILAAAAGRGAYQSGNFDARKEFLGCHFIHHTGANKLDIDADLRSASHREQRHIVRMRQIEL